MILNLYVSVPASDHHAGVVHEVETAPLVLIIHILLGIALICAAGVLFIRAIGDRDRVMIAMTATGLAAILGAYAAGEVFVRNGHKSESLTMAILTGIALLCYIGMLAAMSAAPRAGHAPAAAPGRRLAAEPRTVRRRRAAAPSRQPAERPSAAPGSPRAASRSCRRGRTAPPPFLPGNRRPDRPSVCPNRPSAARRPPDRSPAESRPSDGSPATRRPPDRPSAAGYLPVSAGGAEPPATPASADGRT